MAKPTSSRVISLDAHRPFAKDFMKLVADVERNEGWREHQVLSRWMESACCALRSATLQFDRAAFDANETRYLKVVQLCSDANTMRCFSEMLGLITEALETEPSDFIGPIFSEISASAHLGQFFTPWSICTIMAQLQLQDAREMLAQGQAAGQPFIHCLEPACGVGGMILAAAQVFRELGIDDQRYVHWHATDLDFEAVCGAYIQLTLCGVSADVVHGNSLSLEVFDRLPTIMSIMWPKRQRAVKPTFTITADEKGQTGFSFDSEKAA